MVALALAPLLLAPVQARTETFHVSGRDRRAEVYAPTRKTDRPPLVLVFHGHGGSGKVMARRLKLHDLWPEAVTVYPQGVPTKGLTDPEGKRDGWQRTPGDEGDRDLKFVDAILEWAKLRFKFDSKRVFAMGHSNGGRFTYVLWAARGDRFAAYGPSGSPASSLLLRMKPASAFVIAGEKDPLVPFAAQKRTVDALERMLALGEWRSGAGYSRYAKGRGGLELGTYLHPGGHEYPSEGARQTIEFFKRTAVPGRTPAPSPPIAQAMPRAPVAPRWDSHTEPASPCTAYGLR